MSIFYKKREELKDEDATLLIQSGYKTSIFTKKINLTSESPLLSLPIMRKKHQVSFKVVTNNKKEARNAPTHIIFLKIILL